MKEIQFKNKNAHHRLNLKGKLITFENGKALVEDKEADLIKELGNPDYKIIEKPRRKSTTKKKGG